MLRGTTEERQEMGPLLLRWAAIGLLGCSMITASISHAGEQPVNTPTLVWNTFLGGTGGTGLEDSATAVAVDGSGNVYVTGVSFVSWGTPVNPHSSPGENYDAFIAKLDGNGVLLWHTFLGGIASPPASGNDYGYDIAVDGSGNVYVTGESETAWGAPVNPFSGGPSDAFVAKLDVNGNLQWHTFLGGVGSDTLGWYGDSGKDLNLDGEGNIYLVGRSFDTWGVPVRPFTGLSDGFVAKLNNSGVLQWNTFLGSSGTVPSSKEDDCVYSVVLDTGGGIYVTGSSAAAWGAPINSYAGGKDVFVAKLNSVGGLEWNSFIGSVEGDDEGFDIALDDTANLYVAGMSFSAWGVPVVAYPGGALTAALVAKLNAGGQLQWHTFLGGAGSNQGSALAVDQLGSVYVAGISETSWDQPQEVFPGGDNGFVAHLNNNNGSLLSHTFLGGEGYDAGYGIAAGKGGELYVAGDGQSSWGTPVDAFEGSSDGFVAKLNNARSLTTVLSGSGKGFIASSVPGIACPGDCNEEYAYGTRITLTAVPDYGSSFRGWSGDCNGSQPTCTVTMEGTMNVHATFHHFPWPLFLPAIQKNLSRE